MPYQFQAYKVYIQYLSDLNPKQNIWCILAVKFRGMKTRPLHEGNCKTTCPAMDLHPYSYFCKQNNFWVNTVLICCPSTYRSYFCSTFVGV